MQNIEGRTLKGSFPRKSLSSQRKTNQDSVLLAYFWSSRFYELSWLIDLLCLVPLFCTKKGKKEVRKKERRNQNENLEVHDLKCLKVFLDYVQGIGSKQTSYNHPNYYKT